MIRPPVAAAVTRVLQDTLQPDDRVILACSGGVDSMVLLEVLARHRGPELAGMDVIVAHFNHGVHAEAERMQELVRHHADAIGLQCWTEAGTLDVQPGESFEHVARKARYNFLGMVAAKYQASAVLTAHTQTDQDETILMMLLEGTGLAGLRGMPIQRPLDDAPGVRLIRPMLDVPRDLVLEFAAEHSVPWHEDPTNADTAILRNRVRHVVLPFLEEHGNPQVRKHLRALSAEAGAWVAESDERVDALLEKVWQRNSSPPTLDMRSMNGEAPALLSAVLLHALKDLGISPRSITRGTIESLVGVATGDPDHSIDLPERWRARKTSDSRLQFVQGGRRDTVMTLAKVRGGTHVIGTAHEVAAPGKNPFSAFGRHFILSVEEVRLTEAQLAEHRIYHPPGEELLQPTFNFVRPYRIRTRRMGDKYRPLGAPGRRPLKALFRDYQVPREHRRDWPLLVDGNDRIIWVPGLPIAEEAKVTDFDARVFRMMLHETGDGSFPWPLRR